MYIKPQGTGRVKVWNREKMIMRKKLLFILLLAVPWGFFSQGQAIQSTQVTKKDLALRPNSHDYLPVHRNNLHQRLDVGQRRVLLRKARQQWKKQMMMNPAKKALYRKQIMMQQRKQVVRQRNRR